MSGIQMPTHCPQCRTATEPRDFHFAPKGQDNGLPGIVATYECRGCGEEKPTEEWCALHKAKESNWKALAAKADSDCVECFGFGIRPHRMDAPDGPICGCRQPSRHQSGWCGVEGCDPTCDCMRVEL